MRRLTISALITVSALSFIRVSRVLAEDPARLVRDSEWKSAEDERKGFHVPEGFEVQIFADESQLGGKPINMAFDARGRLWVTCSQEYPFAVKKEKWSADTTRATGSKDTIRILEDSDGDGRADKVTVFADELNIPTGLQPYKNGCIAWSIPNILFLEDTRATGYADHRPLGKDQKPDPKLLASRTPTKADKRTILFGPLGYEKDTHGMISSMRLGLDGWVYATHGFSNTSHFEVREVRSEKREASEQPQNPSLTPRSSLLTSKTLDITSGSVFRFKPDGSSVELWTSGQVNPFGLCWDSWGNLYSADCHSHPITQLIRGATYPHFGNKADALGFGPVMCEHSHGSTGIAGIIYLDGGVWGAEWDDHMFVGNPVTSKVNHDFITFTGSTPKANERPDFLTSDDGWFRPVDLQLGPDGALYIADFYNKIIGHYEIPLDDKRRDRATGRIWRVVRKGFTGKLRPVVHWSEADSGNLTIREFAVEAAKTSWVFMPPDLSRGIGTSLGGTPLAVGALHWANLAREPSQRVDIPPPVQDLYFLENFPKLAEDSLHRAEAFGFYKGCTREDVLSACKWKVGRVHEAVVAVLAAHPGADSLGPLIELLNRVPPDDPQLIHRLEIAIKEHLRVPNGFAPMDDSKLSKRAIANLLRISCAVPTADAASWLLDQLKSTHKERDLPSPGQNKSGTGPVPLLESDPALLTQVITHIARHLPAEREGELIDLVQKHFADDLDTQLDLFSAVRAGSAGIHAGSHSTNAARDGRAPGLSPRTRQWTAALAERLLDTLSNQKDPGWSPLPASPSSLLTSPSPWFKQRRKCADGTERDFLCSLPPGGEKLTGTLRSKPFPLPEKLSFWLAGHRGFPKDPAHEKNLVRLVDAATGQELARAYPPRNDTARQVIWLANPSKTPPRSSDAAPRTPDATPRSPDAAPRSSDAAPRSSDATPRTPDAAPRSSDAAPRSSDAAPRASDAAPRSSDAAPRSPDAAPRATSATPPSADAAAQIPGKPGQSVRLELVDGDSGTAYAWLAAGGFDPAVVGIPDLGSPVNDKRIRVAAEIAATFPHYPPPIPVGIKKPNPTVKFLPPPHQLVIALRELPHRESYSPDTRVALAKIDYPAWNMPAELLDLARDNDLAASVFGIINDHSEETKATASAFKTLTSRAQIKLASALASSKASAGALLRIAPPRVLADPLVTGKIKALNDAALSQQLADITAKLPPQNDAVNALIASRLKSYDPAKADAKRGEAVFTSTCAVCHRIGVKGNLVGPQLDGIGARGAERLLEDIFDPNRAVDPAFRLHIVKKKGGELVTGLLRRDDVSVRIFADAAAQEHEVRVADIEDDQVSEFSLMPSGFGEVLTEPQVHDLLNFLLERK